MPGPKPLKSQYKETVGKGAKVKTDGWKGYNGLKTLGYEHEVIRQTEDVGINLLPFVIRRPA